MGLRALLLLAQTVVVAGRFALHEYKALINAGQGSPELRRAFGLQAKLEKEVAGTSLAKATFLLATQLIDTGNAAVEEHLRKVKVRRPPTCGVAPGTCAVRPACPSTRQSPGTGLESGLLAWPAAL